LGDSPAVRADETARTPATALGAVPPEIRRDLGKYRLIAEIGRGGMGVVYLAVSRGLEGFRKLVVVKELRPEFLGTAACVAMFMDEARVTARLNHPNIVQTIEVGADGARRFIAMEYLDGQPLQLLVQRALAQSNRLSLRMHLGILVDVLTALEYAHESTDYDGTPLAVVHRDVSPHNVIVTYEGQTKLVDFGISKTKGAVHETRVGVLQGKMRYMAPEQAAGGPVDCRADLFAAGAMLWEAVVGRRPWEDQSDAAILQSLISGKVPRVREAWPDVDPDLACIVERAMSVERDARYATAAAMRSDLERYIVARNVPASARSLGATVSRLFAQDRASRRALIDEHVRALPRGAPSERPSLPPGRAGSPASLAEATLASPTAGAPSSSPGSSLSLPPPPTTVPGEAPDRQVAFWLGRASLQSAMPIAAAAGLGAVLALTAVLAARLRTSDAHVMQPVSVGTPAEVEAEDTPPSQAHVTVIASPASAQVYLDDVAVSNPYVADTIRDTTAHRLRVQAPGCETKTRALTFAEDIELEISLSPDSSPAPVAIPPPVGHQSVRAPSPTAPQPLSPTCDPPYVVDSAGKRHWKVECLDSDASRGAPSDQAAHAMIRAVSAQPKPIDTGSPYRP